MSDLSAWPRCLNSVSATHELMMPCSLLRCPPTRYAQSTDGDKPYSDLEVVKALRVMYRVRRGTAALRAAARGAIAR